MNNLKSDLDKINKEIDLCVVDKCRHIHNVKKAYDVNKNVSRKI
jgi:hypothetical protein